MSRAKSITIQQQGKSTQSGRPQHWHSTNVTKGPQVSLDEFKYGFPSDGLAAVSHKWWGSSSADTNEDVSRNGSANAHDQKRKTEGGSVDGDYVSLIDGKEPERGNGENNLDPKGAVLLSNLRKRAAKEGKEALRLGVSRGYDASKMSEKERKLLLRIFRSSLPRNWRAVSSES